MRLVYLIYEYNRYSERQEFEDKIAELIEEDEDTMYFSPLHAFGWLYDYWDFNVNPELCRDIMRRCDGALVISAPGGTVEDEIEAADEEGLIVDYEAGVWWSYYL